MTKEQEAILCELADRMLAEKSEAEQRQAAIDAQMGVTE